MSMIPDQLPDDETRLAREHGEQNRAEIERARFKIPAEVGVAARTFDKYAELSNPSSVGEEERVRTLEDVNAKMKTGGVDSPDLLFADIALSLLPDELITPAVAEAKSTLEQQNPSLSLIDTAILIEKSADAQPGHIIFRNPIHSDESAIENAVHTNTKARAGVFNLILEQEASVFAVAREFGKSKTVDGFGKGMGPAIISAYESACKIVEENPDPYILAGILHSMMDQKRSDDIKREIAKGQKHGATKYKYANIGMPSHIISKDIKTKDN